VRVDLGTPAVRVVHQHERGTVVGADIADADVLTVAPEVREAERLIAEHLEEFGRPAPVLHIGPAALLASGQVEAAASRRGEQRGRAA
jgi:hypothetical protein